MPFVGENVKGTGETHFGYIFGAIKYEYNELKVPTSLKNVIITGSTPIGKYAFNDCEVESIIITGEITIIEDYTFLNCPSLITVQLPSTITSIGDGAFNFCSSLKNFEIPSSVTTFGEYGPFNGCASLESIVIPQGVTLLGNGIFSACSNLKSVTIPEGVTKIFTSAFANCTSLTSVVLPSTVEYLGMSAFNGCSSLESIVIPLSVTEIDGNGFSNTPLLTIYCEADSRPKNWKYLWNKDDRPVYYSSEWEYDTNGNPVLLS